MNYTPVVIGLIVLVALLATLGAVTGSVPITTMSASALTGLSHSSRSVAGREMEMNDKDFQLQVIEGLAELRTDMRSVKAHLAKLNGKVAAHEKELCERSAQWPQVDDIESRLRPVEDFMISERAAQKTSSAWLDRIWPFIWAAIGILAFLALEHAPQLLKVHAG